MSPTIRRSRLAMLLSMVSLAAAGPSFAGNAPPFASFVALARGTAPRLAESQAEIAQAEGLALQATARPNPVIGIEVENFSGSAPYGGLASAETTVSVQQVLELGGKRSARIDAGRAGVVAAQARAQFAQVDYAAQLAIAYAEAEAAGARLKLTDENLLAAETDARTARQLVDAGREGELRALQANADREAARAERDEAQAARDAAFARLSALAGVPEVFDGVSESLLNRVNAPTPPAGATNPNVSAARAARDVAEARMRVEAGRATPDVTASVGARRLAGDDATAFVAGVSVPLPLFDRNRGATEAARAELAASDARLRQAEIDGVAAFNIAQSQARSAASRVEAAKSGEAAASEAYRLARLGYESGRIPLIEVTSARRALVAAQTRTLDARLARVRAEADLARLTGRIPFGA